MHHKYYFNKKKINQAIFNKKLNWFFDIKSILYQNLEKNKAKEYARQICSDYKNLKNNFNQKKIKIVKLNKFNLKKIKKKSGGKELADIVDTISKLKLSTYFDHFIIQGSVASYDFIFGWSDFDTLVILKDEILRDKTKLLKLRSKLINLYKKIRSFSRLQHHGLIFFTNFDLMNYLPGFLPPQALKHNFTLLSKSKIKFNMLNNSKENISAKLLIEKKKFHKEILKNIITML